AAITASSAGARPTSSGPSRKRSVSARPSAPSPAPPVPRWARRRTLARRRECGSGFPLVEGARSSLKPARGPSRTRPMIGSCSPTSSRTPGRSSVYVFTGAGSDAWKPTLPWVPSHIGFELEWPQRHSAILGFPVVSTYAPVGSYSSTSPSIRYGPFGRAVILTGMGRVLLVGFACAPQPTTEAYTERVKEPGGILL